MAFNGEVADCNQLNTSYFTIHLKAFTVRETMGAHHESMTLTCPFWATVEIAAQHGGYQIETLTDDMSHA